MVEEDEAAVEAWMDGDADGGAAAAAAAESATAAAADERVRGQQHYYDMVHVVREAVSQPKMLEGGSLRHYQLGGLKFLVSLYNNKMNGALPGGCVEECVCLPEE